MSWKCLNRTFYGIETRNREAVAHKLCCLNRTFYGIETLRRKSSIGRSFRLNRTFCGIETGLFMLEPHVDPVLIVPFMELKL